MDAAAQSKFMQHVWGAKSRSLNSYVAGTKLGISALVAIMRALGHSGYKVLGLSVDWADALLALCLGGGGEHAQDRRPGSGSLRRRPSSGSPAISGDGMDLSTIVALAAPGGAGSPSSAFGSGSLTASPRPRPTPRRREGGRRGEKTLSRRGSHSNLGALGRVRNLPRARRSRFRRQRGRSRPQAEVIGAIKELDKKVDGLLSEERRHERHDRRND
jgi:hypothetical protein